MPSVAIDTAVREHAAEGRPVYRIHADRLAALAPNVIITQNQCHVCAGAAACAARDTRLRDVVKLCDAAGSKGVAL